MKRNILYFSNGSIGDFVMSLLLVDSIQKHGDETVVILVPRNNKILAPLAGRYPSVTVIPIGRRNVLSTIGVWAFYFMRHNLVMTAQLESSLPTFAKVLMRLLSIIPGSHWIVFRADSAGSGWHKTLIEYDYDKLYYENLTAALKAADISVPSTVPTLAVTDAESALSTYGLKAGKYLVIHPCAFSSSRSLPRERWTDLFRYIKTQHRNMPVVITGSPEDNSFINDILQGIEQTGIINIAGKVSLPEVAYIISRAKGFVGVDTGITHIAGVVKAKSVVIGNRSNPTWLPTYNENATILYNKDHCTCDGRKGGDCRYIIDGKSYYRCLIDIPQAEIYQAIDNVLAT